MTTISQEVAAIKAADLPQGLKALLTHPEDQMSARMTDGHHPDQVFVHQAKHPETGEPIENKWIPFYALRNWRACDSHAREHGNTLHAGSTADEILSAVKRYRASW